MRKFTPSRYRKPGGARITAAQTLKRWLVLLNLLRAGAYPTKATLAEAVRFDARTIQWDIATLRQEFGAPIEFDREQNGFYLTNRRWRSDDPKRRK